jgi:hypothetical protein
MKNNQSRFAACPAIRGALLLLGLLAFSAGVLWPDSAQRAVAAPPTTQSTVTTVGEKIPSEDPVLKDFHSLGLVDGHTNIFRAACPVRDIAKAMKTTQPSDAQLTDAEARMKRLYDLGIRTIVSFQDPATADPAEGKVSDVAAACALERAAAEKMGIAYVSRPIANSGPNSLETMSDQQVMALADSITDEIFKDAQTGGVLFHCSAGHDRSGTIAAYIRLKYQHWTINEAIDEMRRLGHNWPRYSHNGGVSSWDEDHLRAIALLLAQQPGAKPDAAPAQ